MIPIVFRHGGDPVRKRLVASLAQPGGNLRGVSQLGDEGMTAKRLELISELVPVCGDRPAGEPEQLDRELKPGGTSIRPASLLPSEASLELAAEFMAGTTAYLALPLAQMLAR